MAIVFFTANDGSNVSMDSETSITSSLTNTVTKSSTMSNSSSSDGYTVGNEMISVTGLVSSHKTPNQQGHPTPTSFRKYIEDAINGGTRFTVGFDFGEGNGETKLLDSVDNCVITSRSYVVDKYTDTITVSLTFESQFVSVAAKQTELSPEKLASAKKAYTSPSSSPENGVKMEAKDAGSTFFGSGVEITANLINGLIGSGN